MAQLVKNPQANAGDTRDADLIPGSGRALERGNGNLFQYSCLGNPMDRRAWWTKVHRVPENHRWLSYWAHVKLNYFIICYYKPTFSQHKPIKYFKFTPAKLPITEAWQLRVVTRWVKLSYLCSYCGLGGLSCRLPASAAARPAEGCEVGGEKEDSHPDLILACATEYAKWFVHSLSLKWSYFLKKKIPLGIFQRRKLGLKEFRWLEKPVFMFGFPRADAETRSWLQVDYFAENLYRNGEGRQGRKALMKSTLWSQLSRRSVTEVHWDSLELHPAVKLWFHWVVPSEGYGSWSIIHKPRTTTA